MSEPEDLINEVHMEHLQAVVDLIGRTGASQIQVRYSDDDEPTVWMAVARYDSLDHWEAAGAMNPLRAAMRLAEQLIDGGMCAHCGRPSGLEPELTPGDMPFDVSICWYRYDPELKTYRRACEGDT